MADTKLRTEGDYEIWATADDGIEYKRWAEGNSLGKQPHALASRHPKSGKPFNQLRPSKLKVIQSNGGKANWAKKKQQVADAYAAALRETHPDYQTEEEGLLELASAAFIQGSDDSGGGPAVQARAQFIQEYTGGKQDTQATEEHRHLHITISPGVEVEQRHMMRQLMDVVEGEARDVGDGGEEEKG